MGIMVVKILAGDKRFGWQALQEGSNKVSRKGDAWRAVITTLKIFLWPPQALRCFIQAHHIKQIRSLINVRFQNGSYRSKGTAYPISKGEGNRLLITEQTM